MVHHSKLVNVALWVLRCMLSLKRSSIRGLLALLAWIRQRLVIDKDKPRLPPPPKGIQLPPTQHVLCPSFAPQTEHVTLDKPQDESDRHDGPYTTPNHSLHHSRTSFSATDQLYTKSTSSCAISIGETDAEYESVNSRPSDTHLPNATTIAISLLPITISISPPSQPAPSTAESPSRSSSSEKGWDIAPMSTASLRRWKRGIVVDKCPEGWAARTHAEGALYFFHKEKVLIPPQHYHGDVYSPFVQRIYTDAHMYDPTKATIINEAASQIFGRLQQEIDDQRVQEIMPKEYDLVLEIVNLPDGGVIVGYYFADHASKLLFWMEQFDAFKICSLEIESQYWTHCELYPNCRHYDQETVDEVRGILLHATTDTLTSTTSTALWTAEQNRCFLSILDHIKVKTEADRIWAGAIIEHTQFIHLYGQYGARLERDQTIHGITASSQSRYLKVIEPLLFWGVQAHLAVLEMLWVDHAIDIMAWRLYMEDLGFQSRDLIIDAAILLNGGFAFLSIQSVDNNGLSTPHRSPVQILIYASTVTSYLSKQCDKDTARSNKPRHHVHTPLRVINVVVGGQFAFAILF
ncbi:hypothetical protein HWV62_21808 [Athelia sp. TMB]|nr:hypothetical protein HWV62_21808 [Athelia sp. TMB]